MASGIMGTVTSLVDSLLGSGSSSGSSQSGQSGQSSGGSGINAQQAGQMAQTGMSIASQIPSMISSFASI